MRVNLPQSGQNAITLTGSSRVAGGWRIGQVLPAVALTSSAKGQVTLQIGNNAIGARTALVIDAGQSLKLEVVRLGQQPILKLLDARAPADPAAAAFRSALPRQAGLGPLLANLVPLANQAPSGGPAARIGHLAASLLQLLPDRNAVTGEDGLRQALSNSGLFLEARLARLLAGGRSEALAQDLKAGLLRLLSALQGQRQGQGGTNPAHTARDQVPPPLRGAFPHPQPSSQATLAGPLLAGQAHAELLRQTEGALARLQLNQLSSLPGDNDQGTVWMTELPVRHGQEHHLFGLRIEQEGGGTGKDRRRRSWTVSLAFDLPGLGPVRARISMNGDQVSASIWAEREETTQLFRQHLSELEQQLTTAGLEVGTLACHTGVPPDPQPAADSLRLLDERA